MFTRSGLLIFGFRQGAHLAYAKLALMKIPSLEESEREVAMRNV
jgi:hypothetical protein